MSGEFVQRWQEFLVTFYGSGNQLDWPSELTKLTELVEKNEEGLDSIPPGPFVLPHRDHDDRTTYFAIATDEAQAQELRRILSGVVGPTYTTFTGRPIELDDSDSIHMAAVGLAGSADGVFQFGVVGDSDGVKAATRQQVLMLLDLTRRRPRRRVESLDSFWRLYREFERALVERDDELAKRLLYGSIFQKGTLSGRNRWYLEVRYLASFQRWEELEQLPSLPDLLRLRRPALVSDALAELALRTDPLVTTQTVQERLKVFEEQVGPRFQALVPSVESVRSIASAEYYVLWQITTGDIATAVQDRLKGLSWGEANEIKRYFAEELSTTVVEQEGSVSELVNDALLRGQYDRVLELLSAAEPAENLIQALARSVQCTLNAAAGSLIDRYRGTLGDSVVDAAVNRFRIADIGAAQDISTPTSWGYQINQVATGEITERRFNELVEERPVLDLLRRPEEVEGLVEALQRAASGEGTRPVIDPALRILRRLEEAAGTEDRHLVTRLRWEVIELWGLGNDPGDVTTAEEVVDEIDKLLAIGCSVEDYQRLIETVCVVWGPFLTDRSFGLGIRAIEILASGQPTGETNLRSFAGPIFSRVTSANVGRLRVEDVLVGDLLSNELGLGLELRSLLAEVLEQTQEEISWSGTIGIYSLDEAATRRAKTVLESVLPGVEVKSNHDHVANDRLRAMVTNVDLMVVATKVATHAATDAIREARGDLPLVYASGKGSSSIVRAVLEWIASRGVARAA